MLALLTVLFSLRVVGQFLVVFFSVEWLPPDNEWASGLIPYPILLAFQFVMILGMVKIAADIARGKGFFALVRPHWSSPMIGLSAVYAGSMALRYIFTMVFFPAMRWSGGTIPIFFHFVLAAFLYRWGKFHAHRAIIESPGNAC
jgi:hypothetical protein